VLHSLAWLSVRRRTGNDGELPQSDLLVPVLSAGIFFGLSARSLGSAHAGGLSLLAAAAILFAAYHVFLALVRLRSRRTASPAGVPRDRIDLYHDRHSAAA
jgi:hypothetical protein